MTAHLTQDLLACPKPDLSFPETLNQSCLKVDY
jgi:hypothetical protein